MSRRVVALASLAAIACRGSVAAPSVPNPPAPKTVAGNWSVQVATTEMGVTCSNVTLSLALHDTMGVTVGGAALAPPDTLVLGSTAGCGTSSPFATTTLTEVQGTTYNGVLTLWLFPAGATYPQLRLDGSQSDSSHMSGALSELNITPWSGSSIGTWSATK